MPYAVKVSPDNVEYIIKWMSQYDFNVDYIRDDLEYDTFFGEDFYAITDGSATEDNVTFTTMSSSSFHTYWRFPYGEQTTLSIIDKKPV